MKEKSNFFNEIIIRRIPQIIGMYIAAVWLGVEIADWMSERFGVSDSFSSYVFVGMLTFLPSVILLAWGHGRPGKDRWAKKELVWLPMNLVLAFFVVKNVVVSEQQKGIEAVTLSSSKIAQLETLVLDSPPPNLFDEVKKPVNHQTVISYFWNNETNDKTLEWLQYGAPWLLAQDLNRTPVLSVKTPYDSTKILSGLVTKGFDKALDIPVSLAMQLANNNSAKWIILGSFKKVEDNILFTAKLIDVITGSEIETISESNQNVLTALNSISKRMSSIMHKFVPRSENIIPDLAISEHTSTNLRAIQHLISAKNNVAFRNDYNAGIEDLKAALKEDNSFAEANVLAANYYRANGDITQAVEQSKQALKLDYKVYQEKVFALKANIFGMTGEQNKAMQVLENWVKFYPSSALGLATLGKNYIYSNQLDSAEGIYQQLANIDNGEHDSLLNLGRIYRLQNNQQQALSVLHQFLDLNPEKIEAYMELADAYKQFMQLDKAKQYYQQASIIGSENYEAEVSLAFVTASEGDYVSALNQLHSLLNQTESNSQKFQIQESIKKLYMQTGQIQKASEILDSQLITGKEALNPLNYTFTIDGGKIELLILAGEYEKALNLIEKLKSDTKPPFTQIASVYALMVFEVQKDYDNYEIELTRFDDFLKTFPIPYYEQMMFAWKANLASWNQNYDEAEKNFNQAIEYSKQSFVRLQTLEIVDMITYAKAESLFRQNRLEESLSELSLILTHNPLFARANYLKAKSYMALGDINKAKEEILKAKEIWRLADENFVGLIYLNQLETELLDS
jgi:tetratricopeptide (TPR) repeat protein